LKQNTAIGIDKLTVWFDNRCVIDEFSLCLAPGEKVILTGRSGSGKSTILRCVLGFVVPEKGSIHIAGEPVTGESIWRLRTRIAYVAQEPDLGVGQVREILERPFAYRTNYHLKGNLARLPELFERFLLPAELLDKDITDLSGGEKQRVGLVSAILLDRPIFLLDEASSAMDKSSRQVMREYLYSDSEITVLSVSHDPEEHSCSDRIVELPYLSDRDKK